MSECPNCAELRERLALFEKMDTRNAEEHDRQVALREAAEARVVALLEAADEECLARDATIYKARTLFREVLRWRDAEQNDPFPHDTRLSIIQWCEALAASDPKASEVIDVGEEQGPCVCDSCKKNLNPKASECPTCDNPRCSEWEEHKKGAKARNE